MSFFFRRVLSLSFLFSLSRHDDDDDDGDFTFSPRYRDHYLTALYTRIKLQKLCGARPTATATATLARVCARTGTYIRVSSVRIYRSRSYIYIYIHTRAREFRLWSIYTKVTPAGMGISSASPPCYKVVLLRANEVVGRVGVRVASFFLFFLSFPVFAGDGRPSERASLSLSRSCASPYTTHFRSTIYRILRLLLVDLLDRKTGTDGELVFECLMEGS